MKKLMRWLHWLMVPPFGLFLYVGAKGCLFLLATRYGEDAALALMLAEFIFGGVVSVAAILALCYAIAPQGKIAAVIVTGLFCVAFNGYFEDPEETEKILKNGWLYTGDVGYIDDDRYLYIVGRKKNVIVLPSGENIIPEELEREISGLPDVKECLVYEKDGSLAARVYAGETDSETEARLRSEIDALFRSGPSYRKLRFIELSPVPLPKTATGKLKREAALF